VTLTAITNALHHNDSDALAEVRRLQTERQSIQREIDSRTDLSRFDQYVAECRLRFERDKTFDNERALYLAQMIRAEAGRRIEPLLVARRYDTDGSESLNKLFRSNPDWRETLRNACAAKLAVAEGQASEIEKAARAELGEGFDGDAIANHPKVKRATSEVRRWRACVELCAAERDDIKLWKRIMSNLSVA
jgi:hypothetical protein